jgi:bacillithiol system protein YtxJ
MHRRLASEAEAEALVASPQPAWLFKHSNACGVSREALAQITDFLARNPGQDAGVVVVQEQRSLSNWVSNRLKYVHQSPQLFLVQAGSVLWSATHWGITAPAMEATLAALAKSG